MPKKFIRFQVTTQEHASFAAHATRLNEKLDVWARRTLLREMGIELKEQPESDKVLPMREQEKADMFEPNPAFAVGKRTSEQPASDEGIPVSQPEPTLANVASSLPKPISMAERMYQIIEKRDGKAAADAYMARIKERAAIDQSIPEHLKSFYKTIVATQGEEAGRLWLLTNTGGKKIGV